MASTFYNGSVGGALPSSLFSLQKQFALTNTQTGVIVAANEAAVAISIIPITYYAGQKHVFIPHLIAKMMILHGIGCILFILPMIIGGRYDGGDSTSELCDGTGLPDNTAEKPISGDYFVIFLLAQMCIGTAGGGVTSVAATYIDHIVYAVKILYLRIRGDNTEGSSVSAPRSLSSPGSPGQFTKMQDGEVVEAPEAKNTQAGPYLGVLYMSWGLGPAVGFGLSAVFLSSYVYPDEADPPDSTESTFVGQWWAAYVVLAAFSFLMAGALFTCKDLDPDEFVPPPSKDGNHGGSQAIVMNGSSSSLRSRSLDAPLLSEDMLAKENAPLVGSNNGMMLADASTGKDEKYSIAALQRDTRRSMEQMYEICKDPIFIFTAIGGAVTENFTMAAIVARSAQFLEIVYALSSSEAAIVAGVLAIVGGIGGTVIGGLSIRWLKITTVNGLLKLCIVASFISWIMALSFYVLGNDGTSVVGINEPFTGQSGDPVLRFTCNDVTEGCECPTDEVYQPICGSDGLTYYSPCTAGCANETSDGYADCACIDGGDGTGESGTCGGLTWRFIVFVFGFCAFLFFTLVNNPAAIMVQLRIIEEDKHALSLGLGKIFGTLLASIPAPIITGLLLDAVCR
jgi:hypothetical protein